LLRSEYQGWEYQKENPIQLKENSSETINFPFTEKYKGFHPKFIIVQNTP
jgi:hypothetical protein